MFDINSIEDIYKLQGRNAVVSVLVASTMDREAIDWIFRAWHDLHSLTGMNWHLLVPTRTPSHLLKPERDFDPELAEQIRELYRVPLKDTPCLVFDDFNEDHRQHYVRLGAGERRLKDAFLRCAEIIRDQTDRHGGPVGYARQSAIIGEIFNSAQMRSLLAGLVSLAPHVGTIAGLKTSK